MAFKLRYSQINSTPATEYFPATASEVFTVGETLTFSSGKLTKASGTTAPKFICMSNITAPQTGTVLVPVIRVQKHMVFTVPLQASGTLLNRGDSVTIHTDGLQVTATTASGVAEIVEIDGTSVGDTLAVRF